MTLNKLFLGDNSVVDIVTEDTVDEIKLKLATRYQVSRLNPKSYFPVEHDDFSSSYVYHTKKEYLKIFFAKDLNRKVRHSFQLVYPWFTGQIVENGNSRVVRGRIGLPEWTYYSTIIWFAFFTFIYFGWTIKGDDQFKDGEVALYFILFGLISLLIMLVRTRKKVDEMRDEIDRVFSNAR
ncbi:MAG: hypothetical protein HOP30_13240 [Cyclobacteriaceae bacterium]|nr:hypothetical protein [Cyclobacteriaceae bacterium]